MHGRVLERLAYVEGGVDKGEERFGHTLIFTHWGMQGPYRKTWGISVRMHEQGGAVTRVGAESLRGGRRMCSGSGRPSGS